MHTWIPIHKETAQRLLEFRDNQQELIDVMQDMHAQGLPASKIEDKNKSGDPIPLTVMDPFTFLGNFNRGQTDTKRQLLWTLLRERWHLKSPVPQDFDGIPVLQPVSSWFFGYEDKRNPGDIEALWDMFEQDL